MKKNPLKNNKFGFTLVEMMVAIAVFSVVMVVASTALLSIIDASRKAQSIKTAINTLNFALDGISKDVRVGIEYQCIDDTGSPQASCVGGGAKWFGYRSPKAYFDTISKKYEHAYYRYDDEAKIIESCIELESDDDCLDGRDYVPLTTIDEIEIEKMNFFIFDGESGGLMKQPRLIIVLEGRVPGKNGADTVFDLQTSVSQRSRTDE